MLPLVVIRRQIGSAVELPLTLDSSSAVRVAHAQPQRSPVIQSHTDVSALRRIGIFVVDALAIAVKLFTKQVVIKTSASPGQRDIPMRGAKVATIGAEPKLWSPRASVLRPQLDDAGHRV